MSAASSSDPTLSGTFTADKAKAFVLALNLLSKLQIGKIVLEFTVSEAEGKKLYINAINNVSTVFAKVGFDASLLDGIELKESFNFGIHDLNEFVGLLELFKSGFELKMSNEIASINSDENYLDYYAGDEKMIRKAPEGDFDSVPIVSFTSNDTFKTFVDSFGRLNFDHVIFKGSVAQKSVTMAVADKDIRGNTFTKKIPMDNIQRDFRVVIMKEFLKSVITTDTVIDIHEAAVTTLREEELFKIHYIIASLRENSN